MTQEIQVEIQKLDQQSSIDTLTGLLRRDSFASEFASRDGEGIFAVLDIDHFKQINDKKGHAYGDEVLKSVGKIMASYTSEQTILGRWGGEEFVLWTTDQRGLQLLEKIRAEIEATGACTMSIGIAQRLGSECFEKLFQSADTALYQAKKSGRNRMVSSLSLVA